MAVLGSATALEAYRHSLTGISPLKADEERDLAARWRIGDQLAGRKLIEASLPFVITIGRVLSSTATLLVAAVVGCGFSLRRVLRIDPASAIGGSL